MTPSIVTTGCIILILRGINNFIGNDIHICTLKTLLMFVPIEKIDVWTFHKQDSIQKGKQRKIKQNGYGVTQHMRTYIIVFFNLHVQLNQHKYVHMEKCFSHLGVRIR